MDSAFVHCLCFPQLHPALPLLVFLVWLVVLPIALRRLVGCFGWRRSPTCSAESRADDFGQKSLNLPLPLVARFLVNSSGTNVFDPPGRDSVGG